MRLAIRNLLVKPTVLSPMLAGVLNVVYLTVGAALLAVCQVVLHAVNVGGVPQVSWQELVGAAVLAAAGALVNYLHSFFPSPSPNPQPAAVPPAPQG